MKKSYSKLTLDNGVKVISHHMPGRQSVAVGVWIKIGGRYEFEGNKGISHVLEHLLFKGSKKYSCRKIKESIEGAGGALNGFTSEELTCYLAKMPASSWLKGLDILSDMVLQPLLSEDDLVKEKTVILEEIKMYRDHPQSYVYELLDGLLWPDQPLGTPIIGSVETVSAVSRQTLQEYKNAHYTASNIIVSAAGNITSQELAKAVKDIFSSSPKMKINSFLPVIENQDSVRLNVYHKDTEQAHLALGFRAYRRDHPLRHALGILHVILGANMSSRLFNEVREKRGLAYEIGTATKRFSDTGAFIVHAGMDNGKVIDCVSLILNELGRVKESLVTEDEFKRAKEFYTGQLMLALEDTLDHMLWIGETTSTLDRTFTIQDIITEIEQVKRQDLRKVARQIFLENNLNAALIGPLKDIEPDLRQHLKF